MTDHANLIARLNRAIDACINSVCAGCIPPLTEARDALAKQGESRLPSAAELHREMWIQEAVGIRGFTRERAEEAYTRRLTSNSPHLQQDRKADAVEAYWYHQALLALASAPLPTSDADAAFVASAKKLNAQTDAYLDGQRVTRESLDMVIGPVPAVPSRDATFIAEGKKHNAAAKQYLDGQLRAPTLDEIRVALHQSFEAHEDVSGETGTEELA
jgi:hypothetical protein